MASCTYAAKSVLLKLDMLPTGANDGEFSKNVNVDGHIGYLWSILAGQSTEAADSPIKAELTRTSQMVIRHLGGLKACHRALKTIVTSAAPLPQN